MCRAEDEDLAAGVIEQPGDVGGVEAVGAARVGGDRNAVVMLMRQQLTHGVAVRAARFDARVDVHAEGARALLDRLQQGHGFHAFAR